MAVPAGIVVGMAPSSYVSLGTAPPRDGLTLGTGGNGGASESALAADAKVPALDGLGPVGGGFHSEAEYLELKTVTPRLYLLTKLIQELGKAPPPPMK